MFETSNVLEMFRILPVHPGACVGPDGWSDTTGRVVFDAVNPADGTVTARVAAATHADYDAIIDVATRAQTRWRMVPPPRRGELVARIGELAQQHLEGLAAVVALDTGKSLMEARSEVGELIDMAMMAAGQSRMLYGFTQQSQRAKHRMYDQWLPLGVVGVISAYNFPAAVWAQNGFLAAIGGNTVIWKPSPKVPLTALALQALCNQAMKEMDFEGVFTLFLPQDNEVAERLVADTRVALVSFTGSTAVGKRVANIVGSTLGRRYLLECSGNNGCIVDETADLKLAARSITFGAVGTTGQRCTSTRRVIAQRGIANELVELLKRAFEQITVGDPREPGVVVGPLIDAAAVGHFEQAVADAVAQGGTVVSGGKRIERPGNYVEPTLIVGAQPGWQCVQHETFAPIVYVLVYDTLDEAIEIHNGVPQGLASGIHSTNLSNIELFLSAQGSDCGIAKVNMGTTGADIGAAFGGEKETGGGRTAGSDAWKGYMRRQSVCVNWGGESPWDQRIKL
ncbi:aldehyde dehydrogenase family protein [Pandoraea anhela]|uniref:Aldehyde dehydrogenase n=1 Tax=Pandoraea anhela TaxID=2508295 RepID=A0A5E4X4C0_9BURK|nr:aldehyde dehydrogenase family protein [Pandoraea anhela]VVE31120.1 aldehyde dehydrogenase [Pandoraea anhela]